MSIHSRFVLFREWTTIHFSCRVHSLCSFLTVTSLNSMIIKLLVCSPAFATLQLLFAGTQDIARERPYRSLYQTVGLFGPTSRPVDQGHRAAVNISSIQEARLTVIAQHHVQA